MNNKYSIKDIERISGIKAHTLRIWEQRYRVLSPERSLSNIRSYSSDELRKILNISLLNQHGFKISHIAGMSNEQIQAEVLSITETDHGFQNQISALTLSMVSMDEQRFEKIVASNILRYGFEKTMVRILYPFLDKVGTMWLAGAISPAQEHFISNLIRQKLIVAIDGQLNTNTEVTKKFVLFCPEGELHEIGLLFMNYLVRSRNHRAIYLGVSLPFDNLYDVCEVHHPDFLVVMITTTPSGSVLQEYIQRICEAFPQQKIWFAGYQMRKYQQALPSNALILNGIEQATFELESLGDRNIFPDQNLLGKN